MQIILEKERASRAWERIREVKAVANGLRGNPEDGTNAGRLEGRYRSQVRGGPAMIQRNGLGQYLAFLAASGFAGGDLQPANKPKEHADGLLYQHLGAWVLKAVGGQLNEPATDQVKPGNGKERDPLAFLLEPSTNLEHLLWATREVMAFLQWSRRFAESQLEDVKED
jgi:CRISPR type III-B/RAMP module-associated protein Cmr5